MMRRSLLLLSVLIVTTSLIYGGQGPDRRSSILGKRKRDDVESTTRKKTKLELTHELCEAVSNNDIGVINGILGDKNPQVFRLEDGSHAIHWAIAEASPRTIAEVLSRYPHPQITLNSEGRNYSPLLHVAAMAAQDERVMRLLIQKGADANLPDRHNKIPLDYALKCKTPGITPLWRATSRSRKTELLYKFLEKGKYESALQLVRNGAYTHWENGAYGYKTAISYARENTLNHPNNKKLEELIIEMNLYKSSPN